MKTTEEYAIDLVVSGAEHVAEDDLNESEEIAEADHGPACDLAIEIAHAIRDNPAAALALARPAPAAPVRTVVLTGWSDDTIEVDGDIDEEFPYQDHTKDGGDLVAFSDGTVLRIAYSDAGVWRISPVARGSATLQIDQAPEDAEEDYTDRATLTGDVSWAVHGMAWAKAAGK
jgi:hypothetical protein